MPLSTQPIEHAFVHVEKAFEDEINTPSGLKLYLDASYDKANHVSVVGKIAALPISPKGIGKRISKQLNVGDEVCFSYRVCADIEHLVTDGYFTEITNPDEKYLKRWTNAKQEWITKAAMRTSTNAIQWTGVHTDVYGDVVSGEVGSESRVDRWLSKFAFSNEDRYKFRNLLGLEGQDVWKVRLDEIFAKKTEDGILPVGDKLLLKPIDIDVKHRIEIMRGIHIPAKSVVERWYDRATLLHDFAPFDLKKGDIVAFQEQYIEKYDFYGEAYFLLKVSRVIGKWSGRPTINSVMK